jgi:hypothetical protein
MANNPRQQRARLGLPPVPMPDPKATRAPWGPGMFPLGPAGGGGNFTPAYPILTEEVGYPPSPLANAGTTSPAGSTAGRGAALGPIVTKALQDVLGWKIKGGDAKGFVGALTQSFSLAMVEGRVESTWTPRSYAVQSDLAGGIAGAQASIYTMAKTLLDQALPLVDGLFALNPAADADFVAAIKPLVTSQFTELVNELGALGGPRVARVHQYFRMLLGVRLSITATTLTISLPGTTEGAVPPWSDPEKVKGTLGNLRDQLGLAEAVAGQQKSFVNTVDDEQNVTNFRILVNYASSLLSSWQNNFVFFMSTASPFLGTQLVIISRQLGVVSEAVDEVRFTLDSVFVGPSERETFLLLTPGAATLDYVGFASPSGGGLAGPVHLPPIYLEDFLSWSQKFVTEEAPSIIQSGGKLALGEDFTNMIWQLCQYAYATLSFAQNSSGGSAIGTDRVLYALSKLSGQLFELFTSANAVGTRI